MPTPPPAHPHGARDPHLIALARLGNGWIVARDKGQVRKCPPALPSEVQGQLSLDSQLRTTSEECAVWSPGLLTPRLPRGAPCPRQLPRRQGHSPQEVTVHGLRGHLHRNLVGDSTVTGGRLEPLILAVITGCCHAPHTPAGPGASTSPGFLSVR